MKTIRFEIQEVTIPSAFNRRFFMGRIEGEKDWRYESDSSDTLRREVMEKLDSGMIFLFQEPIIIKSEVNIF